MAAEGNGVHETHIYKDSAFPFKMYIATSEKVTPDAVGFKTLHWHEELEFIVVTEGTVELEIQGKKYMLKTGEGIFINKGILHITPFISPGGRYICFDFLGKVLSFFSGSRMEQDLVLPYINNISFPAVVFYPDREKDRCILEMLRELYRLKTGAEKREYLEYYISLLLGKMWYLLITGFAKDVKPVSKKEVRQLERIQKMVLYVQKHYMEEITVADIASSVYISVTECQRCFHQMLNSSPSKYLMEYRMEQSVELLNQSSLSISEIANQVGFNYPSHFIQNFKKVLGVTPKEYRNLHKK